MVSTNVYNCTGPFTLPIATDHHLKIMSYTTPTPVTGIFNFTYQDLSPIVNIVSDSVIMPPIEIEAKFTLKLHNITVEFEVTNVRPSISSIYPSSDNEQLIITARSDNVKGSCLLYSPQGIFYSTMIDLATVTNEYKVPITIRNFKGETIIFIQCYNNKAQRSVDLDIDKGEVDVDFGDNQFGDRSKNAGNYNSVLSASAKIGKWFKDAFSTIFNLTSNTVGSFFLGVLILIIVALCFIPILKILWFITKWIWGKTFVNAWQRVRVRFMRRQEFKTLSSKYLA